MKTDYTIFLPDGTEERGEIDWPEDPEFKRLDPFLVGVLGVASAHFEHVTVLHDGQRHDMFVDDSGHIKKLPRNESATTIYRQATMVRQPGIDPESLPFITGPAVLFYRRVWF